ncbi:hypothetical protein IKF03_02735 [Candidatus Saccharibacteria bacterium]|nr:hypothetical protein [Candidatus Saccharibacteria bacterium]
MPSNAKEDDSGIEKLDFSVRTYNCLKRARINTVDDVVNLPKKDWLRVRNFGRKNLKEVVEKMHSAGYEDFYIDIPE